MAALPVKGYTPIKADMLFKKDQFRTMGKRTVYTVTAEPSIHPIANLVLIDVTTSTGTHKTLRLPYPSMVMKKQ